MLHAFELYIDDIPLDRAQDTMFRFGRAYPGFWDATGEGANCPRRVEWLDAQGAVRAVSDYGERRRYLSHVARASNGAARGALGIPARAAAAGRLAQIGVAALPPARVLRMPFLAYPRGRRSEGAVASGLRAPRARDPARRARHPAVLRASVATIREGLLRGPLLEPRRREARATRASSCLGPRARRWSGGTATRSSTAPRPACSANFAISIFLLFLIAHFHRAALLSMSDQLAVAMNRLEIGDTESVKLFKRSIRQAMEIFLRFTHRYWYHEVSNQDFARSVFEKLRNTSPPRCCTRRCARK